jgi:NitT/TauT family transport system substrate-binding protein
MTMRSRHNVPQLLTILAAAFLLAACATPTTQTPEPTEAVVATPEVTDAATETAEPTEAPVETVKLKTVLLPFMSWAPLSIAYKEGYFSEQGIELEFIEMERSADAIPLLAQGQLDVLAGVSSAGLFNLMAQGEPIKIVADKGFIDPDAECSYSPIVARTALMESGELKSAADLAGRTLVARQGDFSEYIMDKLLESGGVGHDDVTWVDVPLTASIDAFKEGSIDSVYVAEPWTSRIIGSGVAQQFADDADLIPDSEVAYIFYGPNLITDRPDVGERFMVAYLKGVRQYLEGKTERNIALMAEHTELEPDFIKAACWPPMRADGTINTEGVVDFQEWAIERGYMEETVAPDVFWDPHFVEFANAKIDATAP